MCSIKWNTRATIFLKTVYLFSKNNKLSYLPQRLCRVTTALSLLLSRIIYPTNNFGRWNGIQTVYKISSHCCCTRINAYYQVYNISNNFTFNINKNKDLTPQVLDISAWIVSLDYLSEIPFVCIIPIIRILSFRQNLIIIQQVNNKLLKSTVI